MGGLGPPGVRIFCGYCVFMRSHMMDGVWGVAVCIAEYPEW